MFINHLFAGNKFAQIVGEEDESVINILEKPYMVDDLVSLMWSNLTPTPTPTLNPTTNP